MGKRLSAALAAAVLALGAGAPPAQAAQDLLFGGGSVEGVYYRVALGVCNLVNKYADGKYNCIARPSLGSVFNVKHADRGLLDFGVVQSDVNWQAANGAGEWEGEPVEGLRSVFSVHEETVLLVARADAGIATVEDLRGHKVNIGNPGSGQRGNAEDVLALYGIDVESGVEALGLQQSEASTAIVEGQIDAFFYTVGNPADAVRQPAEQADVRIVPIDSEAVRRFVAERPYYVMTTLAPGTYRGVDRPVETYAVKATVVASAGLSEEVVHDVVTIVFDHLDELRASHEAFDALDPAMMLKGLSAPLHEGAVRYYEAGGLM
jgi:hypothetical protein